MEQEKKEEKTNRKSPGSKHHRGNAGRALRLGEIWGTAEQGGETQAAVSQPAGEGKAVVGDGSGRKTHGKKAAETPKLTQVVHTPSLIYPAATPPPTRHRLRPIGVFLLVLALFAGPPPPPFQGGASFQGRALTLFPSLSWENLS